MDLMETLNNCEDTDNEDDVHDDSESVPSFLIDDQWRQIYVRGQYIKVDKSLSRQKMLLIGQEFVRLKNLSNTYLFNYFKKSNRDMREQISYYDNYVHSDDEGNTEEDVKVVMVKRGRPKASNRRTRQTPRPKSRRIPTKGELKQFAVATKKPSKAKYKRSHEDDLEDEYVQNDSDQASYGTNRRTRSNRQKENYTEDSNFVISKPGPKSRKIGPKSRTNNKAKNHKKTRSKFEEDNSDVELFYQEDIYVDTELTGDEKYEYLKSLCEGFAVKVDTLDCSEFGTLFDDYNASRRDLFDDDHSSDGEMKATVSSLIDSIDNESMKSANDKVKNGSKSKSRMASVDLDDSDADWEETMKNLDREIDHDEKLERVKTCVVIEKICETALKDSPDSPDDFYLNTGNSFATRQHAMAAVVEKCDSDVSTEGNNVAAEDAEDSETEKEDNDNEDTENENDDDDGNGDRNENNDDDRNENDDDDRNGGRNETEKDGNENESTDNENNNQGYKHGRNVQDEDNGSSNSDTEEEDGDAYENHVEERSQGTQVENMLPPSEDDDEDNDDLNSTDVSNDYMPEYCDRSTQHPQPISDHGTVDLYVSSQKLAVVAPVAPVAQPDHNNTNNYSSNSVCHVYDSSPLSQQSNYSQSYSSYQFHSAVPQQQQFMQQHPIQQSIINYPSFDVNNSQVALVNHPPTQHHQQPVISHIHQQSPMLAQNWFPNHHNQPYTYYPNENHTNNQRDYLSEMNFSCEHYLNQNRH